MIQRQRYGGPRTGGPQVWPTLERSYASVPAEDLDGLVEIKREILVKLIPRMQQMLQATGREIWGFRGKPATNDPENL